MNLALNNATNVIEYYRAKGEDVNVDVVTYGPGLHMLRADTSPVKDRIKSLKDAAFPSKIQFSSCGNTKEGMEKKEGQPITVLSERTASQKGDHLLDEGIAVSMARARRPAETTLAHAQAGCKHTAMAVYRYRAPVQIAQSPRRHRGYAATSRSPSPLPQTGIRLSRSWRGFLLLAAAPKEVVKHRKDLAAVADLAHRQRRSVGAQTLIQRPKR